MSNVNEIVDKFGGQSALAKLLGKGQTTVQYWVNTGNIPIKWHSEILKLANDQKIDLCPEDFILSEGLTQNINKTENLVAIMPSKGPTQDQYTLNLGIEKQKEIDGIGMGVLSDGTAFLTGRGLARLCGIDSKHIRSITTDWLFDQEKSTSTPVIKKGNFVAMFNGNVLIDIEYMKKNIDKTPMIEARPLRYFNGTDKSKGVRRIGHIKGAMSSFWKDKFSQDERVMNNDGLKKIYIEGHNLNPDKELIVYCTGGLEASMNWYITHEHMGFKNVKIYDASMREWGNRDDTPMEI
mgnify:CR=1 FL=1